MGVADVDRTLPSNRMIFEIRRDREKFTRFRQELERFMAMYGLSEAERDAFRNEDIAALARLGVHPYMLPQITRLIHGAGYNHNDSEAAQSYARNLIARLD
jgi:Aromatic-ring-opening dioxygenase LigAB, LigA subunit